MGGWARQMSTHAGGSWTKLPKLFQLTSITTRVRKAEVLYNPQACAPQRARRITGVRSGRDLFPLAWPAAVEMPAVQAARTCAAAAILARACQRLRIGSEAPPGT